MSTDLDLLSIFKQRDNFDRFYSLINPEVLDSRTNSILDSIDEYFKLDENKQEIDWDSFYSWYRIVRHPDLDSDDRSIYDKIFDRLISKTTNSTLTDSIMKAFIEKDFATRIADLANQIVDGKRVSIDSIFSLEESYSTTTGRTSELETRIVTDDVLELFKNVVGSGGLRWRLNELNISLGPVRVGDNILVAAFVDSGKTSFVVDQATGFIPQLDEDRPLLYASNEEDGNKIKYRHIQSVTGCSKKDIDEDPIVVRDKYMAMTEGKAKFIVYHDPEMRVQDINSLIKKYNPGVLVLDQLANIAGFEKECSNEVERRTRLAKKARAWSKLMPVISVHQSDGATNGELKIEMNQLYGSKSGMQSAVDAVITIGRPLDMENYHKNLRGIYTPKNKMAGGSLTDPEMKNQCWEVMFQPEICTFKGAM